MMKVLCTRAARCENGATSIEYGLIAALVSVALYSGADALGGMIGGQFKKLSEKVDAAADGGTAGRGTDAIALQGASAGTDYAIRGPLP